MDQEGARNPKGGFPARSRKIRRDPSRCPAKTLGSQVPQQMMLIPVEGQFLSGFQDKFADQGALLQQPPQDKEGPPRPVGAAER